MGKTFAASLLILLTVSCNTVDQFGQDRELDEAALLGALGSHMRRKVSADAVALQSYVLCGGKSDCSTADQFRWDANIVELLASTLHAKVTTLLPPMTFDGVEADVVVRLSKPRLPNDSTAEVTAQFWRRYGEIRLVEYSLKKRRDGWAVVDEQLRGIN